MTPFRCDDMPTEIALLDYPARHLFARMPVPELAKGNSNVLLAFFLFTRAAM
jgi:hypothetical protein